MGLWLLAGGEQWVLRAAGGGVWAEDRPWAGNLELTSLWLAFQAPSHTGLAGPG